MSIISLQNLTKSYKKRIKQSFFKNLFSPKFELIKAVNSISFTLEPGESVAFLGKNGAGKTTTIKMLSGLIYPTDGKVDILGFTPFDRKVDLLKQIGLVMGNKSGLNWDLTAAQSFELLKEIYDIPDIEFQKRVSNLTDTLEVNHRLDTQIRRLSLGERMKMELIGSILHQPKVLFLDEPTIGLDVVSKRKIRDFLRKIQQEYNVTILLTSHDMDDVENVCDRVIIINQGEMVYDNSLKSLFDEYKQYKYVKCVFDELPQNISYDIEGVEIIKSDQTSSTFKVDKNKLAKLISKVSLSENLIDIEIHSTSLEEIIMKLV